MQTNDIWTPTYLKREHFISNFRKNWISGESREREKTNMENKIPHYPIWIEFNLITKKSSRIIYQFHAVCILDSVYKNTAPSAPQPQNLFICLRSCRLCFFSFTSSGADGLSAVNQGPRKFTHSRCMARAGA